MNDFCVIKLLICSLFSRHLGLDRAYMVEDRAQAQMPTNVWEEAHTRGVFAFSNQQKFAQVFHTGGNKEKRKTTEKEKDCKWFKTIS